MIESPPDELPRCPVGQWLRRQNWICSSESRKQEHDEELLLSWQTHGHTTPGCIWTMLFTWVKIDVLYVMCPYSRTPEGCHGKIRRKHRGKKRNQELFTSLLPWNSSIETEYLAIKCGRHLSRAFCCWRQWRVPSEAQHQHQHQASCWP